MEDITPDLLEAIRSDFQKRFDKSENISRLYQKVRDGTATYEEANEFAIEVGEILALAYANNISEEILPDGKMYYNIAQRVLEPTLTSNYELIADVTQQVQTSLNKKAGIGIKAQVPSLNEDRIRGLVDKVSDADKYSDVVWLLKEPVINFSQSIVDDSIRVNAEFQSKLGMRPVITRKIAGNCCDWCRNLAGTYAYPEDVPDDLYRRHRFCRCTVIYDPKDGKGKVQNTHSKKWKTKEENDKINKRKHVPINMDKDERKTEYRKKVGKYNLSYDESKALTDYISSESYRINFKLREEIELDEQEKEFVNNMDSALKKMHHYEGNLSRSLHFIYEEDAETFADEFIVNQEKAFFEYLSTTSSPELYNPEGQVQIYIADSSKGRNLSEINDGEKEVIYERDSRFIVLAKIKENGIWNILLREK